MGHECKPTIFLRSKNFNSSRESQNGLPILTYDTQCSVFEWARRKVAKIKKYKKDHKCIPKDFLRPKIFDSSNESRNG